MTREQKIHSAATFVMDATAAAGFFAFPLYLYRLGATPGDVGVICAVRFGVYTMGCLAAGRLARHFRVGPKIAACGALVWALGHLLLPFQPALLRAVGVSTDAPWAGPFGLVLQPSLVAAAVLGTGASLGLAAFWPAIEAWTGEARDDRGVMRRLVAFNLTWGVAVTITPYPTGLLWESAGRFAFLVAACGGLVAAGLAALLVARRDGSPVVSPAEERSDEALRSRPFLLVAWIGNVLVYLMLGVHREIYPKLAYSLGFRGATLGALLSIRQGCQAAAFYIVGRWMGWRFTYRWMLIGQIASASSFLLLARTESAPVAAVSYIVCGLAGGLIYFSSMYYSVADHSQRERRAGFHEAMVGVGNFFGPLVAGRVAEVIGIPASLKVVPLAAAGLIILIQVAWLLRHRDQERGA